MVEWRYIPLFEKGEDISSIPDFFKGEGRVELYFPFRKRERIKALFRPFSKGESRRENTFSSSKNAEDRSSIPPLEKGGPGGIRRILKRLTPLTPRSSLQSTDPFHLQKVDTFCLIHPGYRTEPFPDRHVQSGTS